MNILLILIAVIVVVILLWLVIAYNGLVRLLSLIHISEPTRPY